MNGTDDKASPADQAWMRMVEHANRAARTTGAERDAARGAAREAFLVFQQLRDAEDGKGDSPT